MAQRKRGTEDGPSRHGGKTRFVVSDERTPSVTVRPGTKLDVQSVVLVDPTLRPARTLGARLCGGTSTCIALVDVSETTRRSAGAGRGRGAS